MLSKTYFMNDEGKSLKMVRSTSNMYAPCFCCDDESFEDQLDAIGYKLRERYIEQGIKNPATEAANRMIEILDVVFDYKVQMQ